MDIEQTKRMNFMIKELRKNGIVSQFSDAVSLAQNLYADGMPESRQQAILMPPQRQEPMQMISSSTTDNNQIEKQEEAENIDSSNIYRIIDRKISYAQREHNEMLKTMLSEMKIEMNQITSRYEQEILSLKNMINNLKNQSIVQKTNQTTLINPVQESTSKIKETPIHVEQPKQMRNDNNGSSPRVGDYNPDNVVLENYFYFGKK
jgi:hypothetical protein